jgi:transposase
MEHTMPSKVFGGIDVAKDELVLHLCDESEHALLDRVFPNTKRGINALRRQLAGFGAVHLCLEPTNRYHLAAALALAGAPQVTLSVVNARAARDFARALMVRGKTDRVDARMLARFACRLTPPPFAPPRDIDLQLRAFTRRIAMLVELGTKEANRLTIAKRSQDPAAVIRSISCVCDQLKRQIAALEEQALALIRHDPALKQHYAQLLSVKGIAKRSGLQILGELAVLPPGMGKRQWVAMAGLDPKPRESGTSVHPPRRISRLGNTNLRRALYMPALVAAHCSGPGRDYYQHLLGKGKKPILALVALMRKTLSAIWGMFQSGQLFDPARFMPSTA